MSDYLPVSWKVAKSLLGTQPALPRKPRLCQHRAVSPMSLPTKISDAGNGASETLNERAGFFRRKPKVRSVGLNMGREARSFLII
jgi:hypothetical protein